MAYQHIFSIWKHTTVHISLNRYITQEVNVGTDKTKEMWNLG